MKDVLQFIMEGGSVVRYHTRPGIKPDTDAHHSHGVALLCSLLAGRDEYGVTKASATLLMAALTHDLGEQLACDVSAPAKHLLGLGDKLCTIEGQVLNDFGMNYEKLLNGDDRTILKLADCFDGMLYCCRELALGNKGVMLVWRRYCNYIGDVVNGQGSLPIALGLRASTMFESIKDIYHEVTGPSGPEFDIFAGK